MEFSFDIRGFLKPSGKTQIDLIALQAGFVQPFDIDSNRKELFEGYLRYNQDLKRLIGNQQYKQWVNGSFISTKLNPKDIDLISLIEYQIIDQHEAKLNQFIKQEGQKAYGVDGYIVRVYPKDHPHYIRTQSDLAYWEHWFSNSRKSRNRQRYPKGFIELNF